ncbi:MAG TPA: hypothetical protein VF420_03885 [Casimicrobiaceae bacterium]
MNADKVESFARLAGTVALLATYKFGLGGGFFRMKRRLARARSSAICKPRAAGEHGPASTKPLDDRPRRQRREISGLMVAAWVALLLLIVAYATVRGESALSDLDEIRLIADF